MIPSPTRAGWIVAATAIAITLLGAIAANQYVAATGVISLVALGCLYLTYLPASVYLRRKLVEISWWIPPGAADGGALRCQQRLTVNVRLRNFSPRTMFVVKLDAKCTEGFSLQPSENIAAPRNTQVEFSMKGRPHCVGYHVAHGAMLTTRDRLGLFEIRSYFPNPIGLRVFPQHIRGTPMTISQVATQGLEMPGIRNVRTRGVSGEVRELREYSAGDPFKLIAWKASGRRRRLLVRDLESEIVLSCQILLDVGYSMRHGSPGKSRLDRGIEIATAIAEAEIENGNQVGLITFDTRVHSQLAPGTGHVHRLQLLDRLIELRSVVDEDMTSVTPGELVGKLSDYLMYQEGLDLRLKATPDLEDPKWQHIQAGPDGALYDLRTVQESANAFIRNIKKIEGVANTPSWWWNKVKIGKDSPDLFADLRLFCRLRGIRLPYRHGWAHGTRSVGLDWAITKAVTGQRCDVVVLISDFRGMFEDETVAKRALLSARRRGRIVSAWYPSLPARVGKETRSALIARDILVQHEEDQRRETAQLLRSYGVQLQSAKRLKPPTTEGSTTSIPVQR